MQITSVVLCAALLFLVRKVRAGTSDAFTTWQQTYPCKVRGVVFVADVEEEPCD